MVLPKLQKLSLQALSCLILALTSHGYTRTAESIGGSLDLSNLDLARHGLVDLTGEWAFFPSEFIDPLSTAPAMQLLRPDEVWKDDNELTRYGYGSYRMIITLPQSTSRYSLNVSPRYLAYNLYVNGELVAQNGTPGKTASASQLAFQYNIINLDPISSNRLILVFHVSNFEFPETSLAFDTPVGITLGRTEDVQAVNQLESANNFVAISVYATLGIFCIGISLFNRDKKRHTFLQRNLSNFTSEDVFSWRAFFQHNSKALMATWPTYGSKYIYGTYGCRVLIYGRNFSTRIP